MIDAPKIVGRIYILPWATWEKIRRMAKDATVERGILGLLAILASLLSLHAAGIIQKIQPQADLDIAHLIRSARMFALCLIMWFALQVLIGLFIPAEIVDFGNIEAFVDASLKSRDKDDVSFGNLKKNAINQWDKSNLSQTFIRFVILCVLAICYGSLAASLVFLARSLFPSLLSAFP